jgi:hypothetical protein
MEKSICRLSFWLGIASLAICLIWRVVSVFVAVPVGPLSFNSFYKAALLFLVTTIAAKAYMSAASQK